MSDQWARRLLSRSADSLALVQCGQSELGATAMALDQAAQTDPMQEFYRALEGKSMDALWRRAQAGERPVEPLPPYQPAYWRSADILPFMQRAGELVQPGPDAQRRVIQLV